MQQQVVVKTHNSHNEVKLFHDDRYHFYAGSKWLVVGYIGESTSIGRVVETDGTGDGKRRKEEMSGREKKRRKKEERKRKEKKEKEKKRNEREREKESVQVCSGFQNPNLYSFRIFELKFYFCIILIVFSFLTNTMQK